MKKAKSKNLINVTSAKILLCVRDINKRKIMPSSELVYLVLRGSPLVSSFNYCLTFSTLISVRKKIVISILKRLTLLGYLNATLSSDFNSTYYSINKSGEEILDLFELKHNIDFPKSKTKDAPLFIHEK